MTCGWRVYVDIRGSSTRNVRECKVSVTAVHLLRRDSGPCNVLYEAYSAKNRESNLFYPGYCRSRGSKLYKKVLLVKSVDSSGFYLLDTCCRPRPVLLGENLAMQLQYPAHVSPYLEVI